MYMYSGPDYGAWIYNYLCKQCLSPCTKVVNSNPVNGEVYSIQHYVTMFVNDLRQVGGFLRVLRFPPPIKDDDHYECIYPSNIEML
jgi:hypothetical protein